MKGSFALKVIVYLALALLALVLVITFLGNINTLKTVFLDLFSLG